MMRVETIDGMLYFGDVEFVNEFVSIIPKRILVYNVAEKGYMELGNLPSNIFIPNVRINNIITVEDELFDSEKQPDNNEEVEVDEEVLEEVEEEDEVISVDDI